MAEMRDERGDSEWRHDDRDAASDVVDSGNAPGDRRRDPLPSLEVRGRRIGEFELEERIGRGGMGEVYRARRVVGGFEQTVAVKILRSDVDSERMLERFQAERETLAALDHPGIARLIAGGSTERGRPYLVMEYVEGRPIDVFCDERRLGIDERLVLFREVCEAVDHAHRHLVIHRDLKPGNILVTDDGHAKLLDFGIAKVLPGGDIVARNLTRETVLMTPQYASPEQVYGEKLTTATDVYALTVVLYQLLVGRPPYRLDSASAFDIVRAVESEPLEPSRLLGSEEEMVTEAAGEQTVERLAAARSTTPERLRKRLSGDIDAVVMKGLRRDPRARYPSAAALADDLGAHLDGHAVSARRGRMSYRLSKFARRHRVGVGVAVVLLLSLVAGVLSTWRQAEIAERERQRAERRFEEVRELAGTLLFELNDELAELPGSTQVRQRIVENSLRYLDNLSAEAGEDPDLMRDLVAGYERIGAVLGNPNAANLGDSDGALESYRKALEINRQLQEIAGANRHTVRAAAVLHERIADVLAWRGKVAEALEEQRRSLELFEGIAEAHSLEEEAVRSLAISRVKRGDLLGHPAFPNAGDLPGARFQYRRALDLLERAIAAGASEWETRRYVALVQERLGTIAVEGDELEAALRHYRDSLTARRELARERRHHVEARRDVAVAYEKIGDIYLEVGDLAAANDRYGRALETYEALATADPSNANAARSLALGLEKLAEVEAARGDEDSARRRLLRAIELRLALSEGDPQNVRYHSELETTRERLLELGGSLDRDADHANHRR